jgi:hypothetical protein
MPTIVTPDHRFDIVCDPQDDEVLEAMRMLNNDQSRPIVMPRHRLYYIDGVRVPGDVAHAVLHGRLRWPPL